MLTKYFLQVRDGVVVGKLTSTNREWVDVTIPPDLIEVSESVYADTLVGSTRQNDGTFTPPVTTSLRVLPRRAFLRRFTFAERVSIRAAIRGGDEVLADMFDLMGEGEISLDHQETIAGLAYLSGATVQGHTIAAPILAAGRAAQIRA